MYRGEVGGRGEGREEEGYLRSICSYQTLIAAADHLIQSLKQPGAETWSMGGVSVGPPNRRPESLPGRPGGPLLVLGQEVTQDRVAAIPAVTSPRPCGGGLPQSWKLRGKCRGSNETMPFSSALRRGEKRAGNAALLWALKLAVPSGSREAALQ